MMSSTTDVNQPMASPAVAAGAPPMILGVVAGEGELPVHVAAQARALGHRVTAFSLSRSNRRALGLATSSDVTPIQLGTMSRNLELMREHHIEGVVFAGKVNKWVLLRNPKLDAMAMGMLSRLVRRADDDVMRAIVDVIETRGGVRVLPQTMFLQDLMPAAGLLTQRAPDQYEMRDINYGFEIAKTIGGLDLGQSVVVHEGMVIAVEAIEGTDRCIIRSGLLARHRGGVLVKVAKPAQDQRFDVPTIGLRTLKNLRRARLTTLAFEAERTLVLDQAEMVQEANRHGIAIVGINPTAP